MTIMGCLRRLCVYLIELTAIFLLVVYVPGLPPFGNFTANTIVPSKPLELEYALNTQLNNADRLYVNRVRGAESFAEWKGELYTGVHGGEVVKLLPNGQVVYVTKIGKPCDGYWQESKCGRPLGIAFDKTGILYISDAYYGIWKVDIQTNKKTMLISPEQEIEGRSPKLFNSLALASNGDIYWTDSSSDIQLQDGVYGMLLDGTGRLFHYDAQKKKSKVLLDGLWFANGVVLSPNEDFVVVSETGRGQLRRYYLKGDKKGTDDIFVDGLPGVPDNLHVDSDGIVVPLVAPRDPSHPIIFQSIAPHPLLRKFIARLLYSMEFPFQLLQKYLPHYVFERATHWIGHFESMQALVPKRTTIVKLNWNGQVLGAWHCLDKSLSGISEAYPFKNNLYLGSPYNTYIGRVPIPHNFYDSSPKATILKEAATKTTQQTTTTTKQAPTTTTPRPTTTTPRPTTTTPKPTPAPTTTPKPTQAPTTTPKPTQAPTKAPKATDSPKTTVKPPKPEEKPKPVVEDIPSDTKPPNKDRLKVIKKEGPIEMPHPDSVKTEL